MFKNYVFLPVRYYPSYLYLNVQIFVRPQNTHCVKKSSVIIYVFFFVIPEFLCCHVYVYVDDNSNLQDQLFFLNSTFLKSKAYQTKKIKQNFDRINKFVQNMPVVQQYHPKTFKKNIYTRIKSRFAHIHTYTHQCICKQMRIIQLR